MAHDETIATANGQTPEIQTGTAAKGTAALLRLSEVALSASVIFGLFQTPGIEDHLPDLLPSLTQAVALSPSDLAVLLAVLLAAAMTLLLTATLTLIDRGIARRLQPGRDTSSGMNRTSTRHAPGRLISAVVLTGLIAISAILLVDGETTSRARAAALAATIGAWGVTIATLRLALAPPHADRRSPHPSARHAPAARAYARSVAVAAGPAFRRRHGHDQDGSRRAGLGFAPAAEYLGHRADAER